MGTIVAATAQTVGQLIAANALIGVAAAPQISFNYVLGEIVPVKHRFFANSMLFLIAFPITGMGPYFSRLFIVYTAGGWRWDYYFSIIISQSSRSLCQIASFALLTDVLRFYRHALLVPFLSSTELRGSPQESITHARDQGFGHRRNHPIHGWAYSLHYGMSWAHCLSLNHPKPLVWSTLR